MRDTISVATSSKNPRRRRRTSVMNQHDRESFGHLLRHSRCLASRNCVLGACCMIMMVLCRAQSCEAFVIPQYTNCQPSTIRRQSRTPAPEPASASASAERCSPLYAKPLASKRGPVSLESKNKKRRNVAAPDDFRLELTMLNHDLLNKQEEYDLAKKLQRSRELQDKIDRLLEEKKMEAYLSASEDELLKNNNVDFDVDDELQLKDDEEEGGEYQQFSRYAGGSRSMTEYDATVAEYGWHPSAVQAKSVLLEQHDRQSRTTRALMLQDDTDFPESGNNNILVDDQVDEWEGLTEDDIVQNLQVPGGKAEMQSILLDGAQARDILIRSNLKLVTSISKRWARMSAAGDTETLYSLYSGGWNRPSQSEAVQEGVIGLTTAVERFNPERGWRFSTYATYWITNSIRQCFQRASTGCLRLPINYYDTTTKYKKLRKHYYDMEGSVPAMSVLAREMGMTEQRLQLMLGLTRPLLSTDGLLVPSSGTMTRPGKAGNVNRSDANLLLSDRLVDEADANPEYRVELSLLRQSLENALNNELAPFERDVLRLRLGLDDGVTRTCREVAVECGGRLSSTEIRTTEKRALKKLRSPVALATYKLLAYLDFADVDRETVKMT